MKFFTLLTAGAMAISGAFAAPVDAAPVLDKMPINNVPQVVTAMEALVSSVKTHTGAMNVTMTQVQNNKISKDQAADSVLGPIEGVKIDLTKIVTSLTGKAGIPVAGGDVDRVLALTNVLLEEVLFTVKTLVTILGLRVQLISLLHSVFTLVAKIVLLLNGLVPGLLTPLVAGLSPLLAGLGNGVLAPVLTPIVALVAGIAGP